MNKDTENLQPRMAQSDPLSRVPDSDDRRARLDVALRQRIAVAGGLAMVAEHSPETTAKVLQGLQPEDSVVMK